MLIDKLKKLIQPVLTTLGYELWGIEVQTHGGNTLLRIYIDFSIDANSAEYDKSLSKNEATKYISLEDCSRASREISAILDVEDPINGVYTLEISSPGENRPLFTLEHYERFLGEQVHIKLFTKDKDGKKKYTGIINKIMKDKKSIIVTTDEKPVEIPIINIEKANLIYSKK